MTCFVTTVAKSHMSSLWQVHSSQSAIFLTFIFLYFVPYFIKSARLSSVVGALAMALWQINFGKVCFIERRPTFKLGQYLMKIWTKVWSTFMTHSVSGLQATWLRKTRPRTWDQGQGQEILKANAEDIQKPLPQRHISCILHYQIISGVATPGPGRSYALPPGK